MSADKERAHCANSAQRWLGCPPGDEVELAELLAFEREHARQPLIEQLKKLRTELKAERARVAAVRACCAIPTFVVGKGDVDLYHCEVGDSYVIVSDLQKALGAE